MLKPPATPITSSMKARRRHLLLLQEVMPLMQVQMLRYLSRGFGMAQGFRSATKMLLLWSDEDTKKLSGAVEKLEKLSPDIGEFIRLLQVEMKEKEILPKIAEQSRPTKRRRLSPPPHDMEVMRSPAMSYKARKRALRLPVNPGRIDRIKIEIGKERRSETHGAARQPVEAWVADTPEYRDYQAWTALLRRLSVPVLRSQDRLGRERGGGSRHGWLRRASAVGGRPPGGSATGAGRPVQIDVQRYLSKYSLFCRAEVAQCAHGEDEVDRLVRSLEILAGEVESFADLAVMCP
ncbi:hypothetical protein ACP70R_025728 [Stipagrostis hirtigluma subsp. patula]